MGEVAKIRGLYRPKTKIWLTEGKLIFRKLRLNTINNTKFSQKSKSFKSFFKEE